MKVARREKLTRIGADLVNAQEGPVRTLTSNLYEVSRAPGEDGATAALLNVFSTCLLPRVKVATMFPEIESFEPDKILMCTPLCDVFRPHAVSSVSIDRSLRAALCG